MKKLKNRLEAMRFFNTSKQEVCACGEGVWGRLPQASPKQPLLLRKKSSTTGDIVIMRQELVIPTAIIRATATIIIGVL